jgi:hypothetical protein
VVIVPVFSKDSSSPTFSTHPALIIVVPFAEHHEKLIFIPWFEPTTILCYVCAFTVIIIIIIIIIIRLA